MFALRSIPVIDYKKYHGCAVNAKHSRLPRVIPAMQKRLPRGLLKSVPNDSWKDAELDVVLADLGLL